MGNSPVRRALRPGGSAVSGRRNRGLFIGFPIWSMVLAAVTASFLQDLRGRTLFPFVTHGCFGPGEALTTLQRLAPGARIAEPFVLRCDQERDTLEQLSGWSGWG